MRASSPPRLDELGDVLTVKVVADVLQVAENTVYEAIRRHELPAVRIGRRVIVSKSALIRYLQGDPDTGGRTSGTAHDVEGR